ncbi:hypothetical protein H8B13_09620 [Hymenobacter sp. BT188]|uniref:hypothetical protein n=1 Tax=Hymenobacter sp. BT188 TaxID=2763504 RepID=UPI00165135B8|nr:hypothetical protein [Hymenobacter sp. BT188]MBC6607077.1 hypothetical protein [Hymenobacter sp. BT188]
MNYVPFTASLFLLIVSGCSSAVQEQRGEPRQSENVTTPLVPSPAAQPTFNKTLSNDNFTADITSTTPGTLNLTARRAERKIAEIRDSVSGVVTEAVITDLNQNELPEILIFVRGVGANPLGQVYGFEFAEQEWERFQLPTLPPEAADGYQGFDLFRIADNYLMRTFPVYRLTDSPTLPSGGQRTVRYTLDHTLRLTEVTIEDHP